MKSTECYIACVILSILSLFINHNTYLILGGLFLCTGMILDESEKQ